MLEPALLDAEKKPLHSAPVIEEETHADLMNIFEKSNVVMMSPFPGQSPNSFSSLRELLLTNDVFHEVITLKNMLQTTPNEFKEKFFKRWQERISETKDTCLDFNAHVAGANKLYWEIGQALFAPKTIGEMLSLLFPDAKVLRFLENSKASYGFKTYPNASLLQTSSFDNLREIIVLDGVVFDMHCIQPLDFEKQQEFYKAVLQAYPLLTSKLYQWNEPLKALLRDILWANDEGLSPKQMLECLLQQLEMGSTRLTGEYEGSVEASLAYRDFTEYLAFLPDDFREELLSMRYMRRMIANFDDRLDSVLDSLPDTCIESVANHLKWILENPDNDVLLAKKPVVSKEMLSDIKERYQALLPISGDFNPDRFPKNKIDKVVSKIRVTFAYPCLTLIKAIPTPFYTQVIRQGRKKGLLDSLLFILERGLLNDEQQAALNGAILDNKKKLGGVFCIMKKALDNRRFDLFVDCLPHISAKRQLETLKISVNDKTILHSIAKHPSLLRSLLDSLSPSLGIAEALKDGFGFCYTRDRVSVLFMALAFPDSFKMLFERCAPEKRLNVLLDHSLSSFSHVLEEAALNHPDILEIIFQLLPQEDRAAALKMLAIVRSQSKTILGAAVSNPTSLNIIQKWFTEAGELLGIIDEIDIQTRFGTVLESALSNPICASIVLELYPENRRPDALKRSSALYHIPASDPVTLKKVLEQYPLSERYAALVKANGFLSRGAIVHFLDSPDAMLVILKLLPESDRIKAMDQSKLLLQHSSHQPEKLEIFFSLIPQQYRLAQVQKNVPGYQSFLASLWSNNGSLGVTLFALTGNANVSKAYASLEHHIQRGGGANRRWKLSDLEICQLTFMANHGVRPEIKAPETHTFFKPSEWLCEIDCYQLTPKELSILAIVLMGVHGIKHFNATDELDLKPEAFRVTLN